MKINWKKHWIGFQEFWKLVCAVFLGLIVTVFCVMAGIKLLLNGKNLLHDTTLLIPPAGFLIIAIMAGSSAFFLGKQIMEK